MRDDCRFQRFATTDRNQPMVQISQGSRKQAGNSIRQRHTEGSKIAQGESVQYSLLQYPKNPKVGPNWRAKKGNIWNFLTSILLQNIKKIEGGDIKKFRKRISQCQKNWKGAL